VLTTGAPLVTATMRKDPDIIGLCGETKIANKAETWVTMIQGTCQQPSGSHLARADFHGRPCTVFEYYISHHLTKAFEATLGKVTCLPGCFSVRRLPPCFSRVEIPVLTRDRLSPY
jgi:chitin synthase